MEAAVDLHLEETGSQLKDEAMPRYRALTPLPGILNYRGGVQLELHRYFGLHDAENLAYRKLGASHATAWILIRAVSQSPTEIDTRLAEGFEIKPGTPGERIMESLVRLGYAERLD